MEEKAKHFRKLKKIQHLQGSRQDGRTAVLESARVDDMMTTKPIQRQPGGTLQRKCKTNHNDDQSYTTLAKYALVLHSLQLLVMIYQYKQNLFFPSSSSEVLCSSPGLKPRSLSILFFQVSFEHFSLFTEPTAIAFYRCAVHYTPFCYTETKRSTHIHLLRS